MGLVSGEPTKQQVILYYMVAASHDTIYTINIISFDVFVSVSFVSFSHIDNSSKCLDIPRHLVFQLIFLITII